MEHESNCQWEKTTPEQCEFRTTHEYCPHEEHKCNCAASQNIEEEKPKKILTLKQRRWLDDYMDSGDATHAALVAYYPEFPSEKPFSTLNEEQKKIYNAASVIGYENLRKLKIPLDELMDDAGLTDIYLTLKLKENLNATKLYGKNATEGMDGMARNKALEIALKVKGKLTDKVDLTSKGKSLAPLIISDISPDVKSKTETEASS